MIIRSVIPQYGVNYKRGQIGFTMTRDSIISVGIAYFERWVRMSDIAVSHVFIVQGDDQLVEAHIEHGVQRDCISKYFNDPKVTVFFREPFGLTDAMADIIADAAASKVGCKYATGLIAAELAANTLVGHEVNQLLDGKPNEEVSNLLDEPNEFICSGLGAYALRKGFAPTLGEGCAFPGVLSQPVNTINPQMLFEDAWIFKDWVNQSGHGPLLNKL
jgi:hypothetical protein